MSDVANDASDPPEKARTPKRIAVVAVHGVGDHEPFATARAIGDLLSNLEYEPSNTPRYAPFTEVTKRINVRPVRVADKNGHWTEEKLRKAWGPLDALAKSIFTNNDYARHTQAPDNSVDSLDHLFMKGQLVEYKGEDPEDTYQCLRLEGKRVAPAAGGTPAQDEAGQMAEGLRESGVSLPQGSASPGTQEKIVHIYEMYWADLSRLSNGFTQVFGALYQLLFHLGSVSVNNVLAAAIHFQERQNKEKTAKKWRSFANSQSFAAAVLAWPIPILNLYMAAMIPVIILASLMRSHLSAHNEFVALDVLAAALLVAGSAYGLSRLNSVPSFLFRAPLLLFGVLAIGAAFWQEPWNRDLTEGLFAILVLALALGGVWLIVAAYDKRRPGSKTVAKRIGAIFALVVLLAAVESLMGAPRGYPVIAICLNILEITLGFLALTWLAFYLAYIVAHVAGWRAVKAIPAADREYAKARRVRWTAQLILALSSIAFLCVTVVVWTGVVSATIRTFPGQENVPADANATGACRPRQAIPVPVGPADSGPCKGSSCPPVRYEPLVHVIYRSIRNLERQDAYTDLPPFVSCWANETLLTAGVGFLPVLLGVSLAAFLMVLWGIFPSIWDELNPPGVGAGTESEKERQRADLRGKSHSLGVWLDQGFLFARRAGALLYWTVLIPAPLIPFLILGLTYGNPANQTTAEVVVTTIAAVIAGAAIGIFGFAGRLKSVSERLRPLLRVMLDVDNWLRENPRNSNPTARICGRYVSLLRHISAWRDDDGKSPYDAMVIVAHSQGTVITADFLRFLQAETKQAMKEPPATGRSGEKEVSDIGIYDPELNQFGKMDVVFFTMGCPLHQLYALRFPYLYGWARNDAPDQVSEPGKVPDIGPHDAPRPDRLGIVRWVNAYRSGDYIGRYLWRGGGAAYNWDPAQTRYDEDWDPPAGKPENVSADEAGSRVEFCIGPGAHTHYWDHTADLIAEVLDRMINTVGSV